MEFKGVIYIEKKDIEDEDLFSQLPEELANFYENLNGIVAFQGGLQVRGCVHEPKWISLYEAWKGESALHKTYTELTPDDIPFAQDCMGDQYFLRDEMVWILQAETGEVYDLEVDFIDFIDEAIEEPVDFLSLHPLVQYLEDEGELQAGELLHSTPPFCEEVSEDFEYTMKPVPVEERLNWLKAYYTKNYKNQ
jgi:hypothetical protein